MAAKKCPSCGRRPGEDDEFCTGCGARLGAPRMDVLRPRPVEEEPSPAFRALCWFLEMFPGVASPKVIVMSILATVVGAAVGMLGFTLLAFGAALTGIAVCAMGLVCYWTAAAWMMCGYLCMPAEALSEFDGQKWTVFMVLAVAPITLGYAWMAYTR